MGAGFGVVASVLTRLYRKFRRGRRLALGGTELIEQGVFRSERWRRNGDPPCLPDRAATKEGSNMSKDVGQTRMTSPSLPARRCTTRTDRSSDRSAGTPPTGSRSRSERAAQPAGTTQRDHPGTGVRRGVPDVALFGVRRDGRPRERDAGHVSGVWCARGVDLRGRRGLTAVQLPWQRPRRRGVQIPGQGRATTGALLVPLSG